RRVNGLAESGRAAHAEAGVAAVGGGDRVRDGGQRGGREVGHPAGVERAGAEGRRAVLEGHGAGRRAGPRAGYGDRRREGHRLAEGRRVGRGGQRRRRRRRVDLLAQRRRGVAAEVRVAAVDGGDRVGADGQRGGEGGDAAGVEGGRAQRRH